MTTDAIVVKDLKSLDIEELAMNQKFGTLTFNNANKKLQKVKSWLLEFKELDYSNQLPENVVVHINQDLENFNRHIKWLKTFDISTSPNAKQDHDNFENQIDSFYNQFFNPYVINHLSFLRQEVDLKKKDKRKIKQEQKELAQLRRQSEKLVKELSIEKRKIQEEKKKIESAKGERAAIRFGKHFESQTKEYSKGTQKWLKLRDIFFTILLIVILLNIFGYLTLFFRHILYSGNIRPSEFFTLEYGLVKLALLSILSYGVSFSSRNFNVNSNLGALNKHRKNVAETLNDFLESNPEKEDRSKIVENATNAMFKHQPIGYLPKIESRDDGPIGNMLNFFKQG